MTVMSIRGKCVLVTTMGMDSNVWVRVFDQIGIERCEMATVTMSKSKEFLWQYESYGIFAVIHLCIFVSEQVNNCEENYIVLNFFDN